MSTTINPNATPVTLTPPTRAALRFAPVCPPTSVPEPTPPSGPTRPAAACLGDRSRVARALSQLAHRPTASPGTEHSIGSGGASDVGTDTTGPTKPADPHPSRREERRRGRGDAAAWARRRRLLRLAVVLMGVAGLCAMSAPAWAQDAGAVLAQAQSVDQVLDNVRNWLIGILAGLATVMATVGGIRYTMADGDPGEVQRAKTAFRNAGVGYALAALAPLLVTVLQSVVGL